MVHSSNMSILECSLSKLAPYITLLSIPLMYSSLIAATCKVTYVTATIIKLSEIFQGISITLKSGCKKAWDFITMILFADLKFCALAYCVSTYLCPDLFFFLLLHMSTLLHYWSLNQELLTNHHVRCEMPEGRIRQGFWTTQF